VNPRKRWTLDFAERYPAILPLFAMLLGADALFILTHIVQA
jgi:hypothetical protein